MEAALGTFENDAFARVSHCSHKVAPRSPPGFNQIQTNGIRPRPTMGIDWYPFQPKRNDDIGRIQELAERQRRAFHACRDFWFFDSIPAGLEEEVDEDEDNGAGKTRLADYREASQALRDLLEFGSWNGDPRFVESFRVAAIARWWFVPPQWRCQAYRTILPDELPAQLGAWHNWFSELRRGGMRRYLAQLYLHEITMTLFGAWSALREGSVLVRSLTNTWTRRPHLLQLLSEIDALPAPVISPWPIVIPSFSGEQSLDELLRSEIARTDADAESMLKRVRRWNRNVKAGQTGQGELRPFQSFLEQLHDPWIDEFFEWANRWSSQGYGLYLDY